MLEPDQVLVHGLFYAPHSVRSKNGGDGARASREREFAEHAAALGVGSYEWLDGDGKALANRILRRVRGTARAVDAVEVITVNKEALGASLADETGRTLWQEVASCEPRGLDVTRSFILMGAPIQLLDGSGDGQRVIWFGNGLRELSQAEFIRHYTTQHGPLVAGHAELIGLRRYRQVPDEQSGLRASLRELGLGQASPPPVFAELVMGTPRLKLATLRARRAATREIKDDEKRHIDFSSSMLLLAG